MIRFSVMYPGGDNINFDLDYYNTKHRQLCMECIPGLERMDVETGINGPYIAVGHLYFDSPEAMERAFAGPRVGETMDDIPNYTNSVPVRQVSIVVD